MAAKTYIYLDLNVSETAYQTTTTSADSVGIGKVLIGVAEDGASSATYDLTEANQIVGDNILANTIDASKITAGTIDTDRLTATAIDGMTITGATIRTSSSGKRINMSSDILSSYDSGNTERMRLDGEYFQFFDSGGSNTFRIETPTSLLTVVGALGSNRSVLINGQGGSGYAALGIGGLNYIRADASSGDVEMFTDLEMNYNGIVLGGVRRTSWPSAGTTTLSGLTIDTNKNWGGYDITNLGTIEPDAIDMNGDIDMNNNDINAVDHITFNGSGSFIEDLNAIYLQSRSSNPGTPEGSIWFYESGGTVEIRTYIGGNRYRFVLENV